MSDKDEEKLREFYKQHPPKMYTSKWANRWVNMVRKFYRWLVKD